MERVNDFAPPSLASPKARSSIESVSHLPTLIYERAGPTCTKINAEVSNRLLVHQRDRVNMCKVNMLRELMKERLNVATEEIFELFEKTIADYEEKLRRSKEENERRQRELVNALVELRSLLHKEDMQRERQGEVPSEPQEDPAAPLLIKEEEEEDDNFPELVEHNQSEENGGSGQHVKMETEGEHCKDLQSEPDSLFAPLSDMDDIMSDSSETYHSDEVEEPVETNKDCEGDTAHRDDEEPVETERNCELNCSQCEKVFQSKSSLKTPTVAHTGDKPFTWSNKRYTLRHFRKCTGGKALTTEAGEGSREDKPKEHLETTKNAEGVVTRDSANNELNCSLCEKMFYSKRGLKQHMSTHTPNKPFPCLVCDKRFSWKHHVKRHMAIHTREKALTTEADGASKAPPLSDTKRTTKPSRTTKDSDADNHRCSLCHKNFVSSSSLTSHMVAHRGEKPFACSICDRRFSLKQNMLRHEKIHATQKPLPESAARKGFRNMAQLFSLAKTNRNRKKALKSSSSSQSVTTKAGGEHADSEPDTDNVTLNSSDTDHSEDIDESFKTKKKPKGDTTHRNDKKYISCCQCEKKFATEDGLRRHKKIHTGQKSFACAVCDQRFNVKANMLRHEKLHKRPKTFTCSLCRRSFRHRGRLIAHIRAHVDEKASSSSAKADGEHGDQPDVDDVTMDSSDTDHGAGPGDPLKTKKKSKGDVTRCNNNNSKAFKCSQCEKRFTDGNILSRHMLTHTGEKTFACPVCREQFSFKGTLTRHMTLHSEEMPYSCSLCSKRFREKSYISVHMGAHTKQKIFSCSLCTRMFSNKATLAKHMTAHAPGKLLACPVCGKSFNTKSYVKSHMRIHTGEKPFRCRLCHEKFTFRYRLKTHSCPGDAKGSKTRKV
ncbi:zinc finger protein 84-like isoform X2 [Phyllopteryx taeniolatus]|uniref:zinc finger protein 84-like isoform X2 n=1 Tax=Phyllopteryx taeniolatus TaxID=161469 RepID=UPI002AD2E469|nr:zinc finger protein 84-like isoform X2 [Phyllopteryx taeniolatus]